MKNTALSFQVPNPDPESKKIEPSWLTMQIETTKLNLALQKQKTQKSLQKEEKMQEDLQKFQEIYETLQKNKLFQQLSLIDPEE